MASGYWSACTVDEQSSLLSQVLFLKTGPTSNQLERAVQDTYTLQIIPGRTGLDTK